MAASDATPFPIKNQAYRVIFPILDGDGDLVTGAAGLDSEVSKDCGTFTDVTAEATEIATSSGMYYLDLTATEMNADVVAVIVKTTTTGAKTTPIVLYPVENADIPVNVKAISDDTTAPDNLELAFDGTGYGFTNCTMPTVTTLTGHTAQTGDSFARLGAPVGASIAADLLVIDNFVDELESRLTVARAGYIDNLSAGAVALASGVDLTSIHGAALTETVNGYLAAAFVKLFDVSAPLLVASDVMRGTDGANTTTPPTVTAIRQEMDTNSTKMAPSQVLADYKATGFNTVVPDAAGVAPTAAEIKTEVEQAGSTLAQILADTGTDGVLLAATATSAQLVDDIWDEIITGAFHNIVNSAARRLREIGAFAIESGTAQAGTISTITLAATANGTDGLFNRNLIVLTDNTGKGQTRTIIDYNATSKVVVIDRDWRVTPDATTAYQIVPDDTPLTVDHGVVQAATATTITIRDYASSTDGAYLCNIVAILAGTGRGQARLVGSYDGANRKATICGDDWVTTPDTTSVYAMMPYGVACAACVGADACDAMADCVLDELTAEHTIAGSLSDELSDIKTKTDNLPSGTAKGVAFSPFTFLMVLSSDHVTGATGKTVTGTISKDGASPVAVTNAITEVGGGWYKIADGFTDSEANANTMDLTFSASDCNDRHLTIRTT